ncbi:TIM barrel protein [Parageobacillus sp. VR-IP]|uniref:sugar phosphate isomerase/epimerase family protein n=1 Tax=Parageobacillus sp. VR-IP TaxID=2742205 RepID=UPI001582807C|nr:sugar phosphate isomerase/epimerase [Parageobacillus sp. VR-IP]NUK30270.1 TIM barrel protein [Parageobacillus sp. VR-IP]
MGNIGLQLFSIWLEAKRDFISAVKQAADLGYEGVQFAGFLQTPAKELKKVLAEEKLKNAGAHISIEQLLGDQLEKTLEYNETIGNYLLICPALPREMRQSADDYKRSAEILNQIGETCKKAGFTFAYHNHDFEFEKYGVQTGFDILFEQTDPKLVKIELDCYWAAFAGYDPLELINQYKDRIISLHIKDMKFVGNQKKGTTIGDGIIEFQTIIQSGIKIGVQWFIVEQEEFETTLFEELKLNRERLHCMISETKAE